MPDLLHELFRCGLAVSGLSLRQRLSILIYHRVVPERDWMRPAEPTALEFAWQMQLLQHHFNVLPLPEAVTLLRKNCLPPRAACVTFDDGYADNATLAYPILKQFGIPATVFVTSSVINGGRLWNDTIIEALRIYEQPQIDLSELGLPLYDIGGLEERRKAAYAIIRRAKYLEPSQRNEIASHLASLVGALPNDLMLTSGQIRKLHSMGVEIGGHTVSHPILARLSLDQALGEIQQGKRDLEGIVGTRLRAFAYPNGQYGRDYTEEHVALVEKSGFDLAVTTNWGASSADSDPLQLPRFTPWDKSAIKFLFRMASNLRHRHR